MYHDVACFIMLYHGVVMFYRDMTDCIMIYHASFFKKNGKYFVNIKISCNFAVANAHVA